jgi:hypothetical protein
MQQVIGRRDLLKVGAVTTVGSILVPMGSAPSAEAGEGRGVPPGAGLGSDRTLEALKEAVRWPTPAIAAILALTGRYLATGRDAERPGGGTRSFPIS